MESLRPTLVEVVSASKRAAQRTLDMGANRLELLIVELREERERFLAAVLLIMGIATLALLAGIAFTLGVVAVFWEHAPVAALAILMACYAAGAALLYAKLVRLQRTCELFASTLDQLRKDRECLANNLR